MEQTFQKDLLVNDFQQCMYMLRHYDSVNWDLTKFSFGQILVVIGACWTILNYEREADKTLLDVYKDGISNYIVGGILALSTCFVFLTLAAIMRNRTYFVLMGRYLNEHRRNVFKDKPFMSCRLFLPYLQKRFRLQVPLYKLLRQLPQEHYRGLQR